MQGATSEMFLLNETTRVVNPGDNDRITLRSLTSPHYSNTLTSKYHSALSTIDRSPPISGEEAINSNGGQNSRSVKSSESSESKNKKKAPASSPDNSLSDRIRAVWKSSEGISDYLLKFMVVLFGKTAWTIFMGVILIVSISMIVIGSLYAYECPQAESIPIYLIVGGVFWILELLSCLPSRMVVITWLKSLPVTCITVFWFICGTIWVYKAYEPNYDTSLKIYCNETVYLFAFWLTTCIYVVLFLIIIIGLGSIFVQ